MKSINSKYLSRIDHLRFFAASLLIFHHFRGENLKWDGTYTFKQMIILWLNNGSSGVSLFLVLTGFLFCIISDAGRKKIKYSGYIYNRILRIFPLMTLICFIVICISRQSSTPMDILRILTLQLNTGQSFTGWGHDFFPVGPIWTIAVEFHFYLIFPFIALFLNKYGKTYILGLVLLFIFIKFTIATISGSNIYFNLYHTIIGRMDQFIIGMFYALMYINHNSVKLENKLLSTITTLLSLFALTCLFTLKKETVFYCSLSFTIEALAWGLIILCYLKIKLPDNKYLENVLSSLGSISFSLYLLHLPVGTLISKIFQFNQPLNITSSITQSLIRLAFIIGISYLTYFSIEKPFMSLRVKYTNE
ncbi:MAG: acyltransferase [Desulfamplus sp.]|nr:acyltransferase [Desulfamplus sp.]